ncbi:MAG: DUF4367 domain-containing protein [Ruminococcaceae bacterium]|nr:DUF4367 domain-containing protein [Oscillospiraceae bacterium]
MQNNDSKLFKQAISDGLCNRFDSIANSCTEEIECSEKHKLAVRTIVYGKAETKRVWSSRTRRLIAILVAAALLLTSCGIIFRNEIREIFEEFFVKLNYDSDNTTTDIIKEIYTPSYVPDGYMLEKESITSSYTKYEFANETGDWLCFEQRTLPGGEFFVDSESGYSQIETIEKRDIYYRVTAESHHYTWTDGKYSIKIKSNIKLSDEEILLVLDGIKIK